MITLSIHHISPIVNVSHTHHRQLLWLPVHIGATGTHNSSLYKRTMRVLDMRYTLVLKIMIEGFEFSYYIEY
jgi:hypothetical protein